MLAEIEAERRRVEADRVDNDNTPNKSSAATSDTAQLVQESLRNMKYEAQIAEQLAKLSPEMRGKHAVGLRLAYAVQYSATTSEKSTGSNDPVAPGPSTQATITQSDHAELLRNVEYEAEIAAQMVKLSPDMRAKHEAGLRLA